MRRRRERSQKKKKKKNRKKTQLLLLDHIGPLAELYKARNPGKEGEGRVKKEKRRNSKIEKKIPSSHEGVCKETKEIRKQRQRKRKTKKGIAFILPESDDGCATENKKQSLVGLSFRP